MTEVTSICLLNLPLGITELQLRGELLRIFPHGPCETNTVKISIYPPQGIKSMAVVGGFFGNFEEMTKTAKVNKIVGRDIKMKWDRGDERDLDGNFLKKLPSAIVRKLDELRGVSHRKLLGFFNSSFLQEINPKVFDGSSQVSLYLKTNNFQKDFVKRPGELIFSKPFEERNLFRLQYNCVLDKFQAISYLNNNAELSDPLPYFSDISGKERSECSRAKGLGKKGSIIMMNDEKMQHGMIPLDTFDPAVINKSLLTGSYASHCWRCKSKFILKGIDADLNFIAGICACNYSNELDVLDKSRAYHLENEKFTRLSPGQNGMTELIMVHCPMKTNYLHAEHYQNIVLPILQEEWKYSSREFKTANSCSGRLTYFQFVETYETKSGKSNDVFGLQIVIPATKFWCGENLFAIGSVKISMNIFKKIEGKDFTIKSQRKGKICSITNIDKENASICVQLQVESSASPRLNEKVDVVPKPKKSEYNTTKHLIRKCVKNEDLQTPFLHILLNPKTRDNWGVEPMNEGTVLTPRLQSQYAKVLNLHDQLNQEQLTAVRRARLNTVSFIMGPPGTGKTHTASVIALTLSVLEDGPILICAPSNIAADGIALCIEKLCQKNSLEPRVLRIYSKSREMQCMKTGIYSVLKDIHPGKLFETQNQPYKVLQEEVHKLLSDENVKAIIQKIEMGSEYCLKKDEQELIVKHIQKLEMDVMKDYNIFVSTIGAMADQRVASWSSKRPIITVIVDEAGQTIHPSILTTLVVNPSRIIFAGDHLQLSPTVMSYSATTAGLNRSIMEWISLSNTTMCNIPWTTLLEQHRMAPSIREVVSAVTYHNELKDAACVITRDIDVPNAVFIALPELKKSPVAVYDIKDSAREVGTSYMNEGEANQALLLVQKLLAVDVPASKITILTLYEGQRQLIKLKLQSHGNLSEEISVLNVDGFQGRENSIIILSFVRTNTKGSLGFVKIPNRVNVAISRAKHFLLILCNFEIFKAYKSQALKTLHDELINIDNFVC